MSCRFVFYNAPDTFSTTPPHPDHPSPYNKPLSNVSFEPEVFQTPHQRRSAANGILWLPLGSIVAAFAAGHNTYPPADNLTSFVHIRKHWHQDPNQHCTMLLGWNDQQGNHAKTFGQAHVHRNGLESIREWSTGGLLVRPYGQAGYDWHAPAARAVTLQQVVPVPVAKAWTDSDDEAEEEGWGHRVITEGQTGSKTAM